MSSNNDTRVVYTQRYEISVFERKDRKELPLHKFHFDFQSFSIFSDIRGMIFELEKRTGNEYDAVLIDAGGNTATVYTDDGFVAYIVRVN